ncbi:type II toxin-antitoxin system RelE/ParE family toxin [Hymenobacter gummosus]|uniref:type II toxin-antitoxin system RelE/ParE family toxin n=1 Tax=Hymenobacter gummosus TaxID=1776032 RepID=UPI001404A0B7|nr:type II toxin-antitoxin system RelE/ParE family toxin [Hymenobacter gummosus]
MAQIIWATPALEALHSIREFVAQSSPVYADRLIDKLIARVDMLRQFPQAGRVVKEFGSGRYRELPESGYRIVYRIELNGDVGIVHIQHSSLPLTDL